MPQFSAVAVLISILFYCFITSVFSLGILYVVWRCCCRRFRSSSPSDVDEAAPGSTIVRVMQPQLGLEVSVIQTFPKFVYSADQEGSKGAVSECVVCLGTFEADEILRQIPKCGHIFHAQCVDVWLQSHATCPYCRANLFPQQQPQQQLNDAQPHRDVRITVLDHTERASPITATYIV